MRRTGRRAALLPTVIWGAGDGRLVDRYGNPWMVNITAEQR